MKTDIQILSLFLILSLAHCVSANGQANAQIDGSSTNIFALNQNDIKDEIGDEQAYYVDCIIHHIVMPETLPSDLDTNGNWGLETNGLQMSLRFRDRNFTLGRPVPALIILRNLEPASRTLLLTNSSSFFAKVLVRISNVYLPERKEPTVIQRDITYPISSPPNGFIEWQLPGRSEKALLLNLGRMFDLDKAGEYKAVAICRVYSPATNVLYEVESGSASFTLVNPAKSP